MTEEENELAEAERRTEQARQILEREKQRIADIDAAGGDSRGAREMLKVCETNLRILEGHRDYLKHRRKAD